MDGLFICPKKSHVHGFFGFCGTQQKTMFFLLKFHLSITCHPKPPFFKLCFSIKNYFLSSSLNKLHCLMSSPLPPPKKGKAICLHMCPLEDIFSACIQNNSLCQSFGAAAGRRIQTPENPEFSNVREKS